MFTRRVVFQIMPDSSDEFKRIVEGQFLPPLRAQAGCCHEDTFITPVFSEAVVNSYWDTEEYAEEYARTAYPKGLQALAGVLDGAPLVESFQISSSTFHKIAANRREEYRTSQQHGG
jgi:hypothetical protein